MGCSAHVIPTQRQTSVAPDPAGGPLTTLPRESFVLALADGSPPARSPRSVVQERRACAAEQVGAEPTRPIASHTPRISYVMVRVVLWAGLGGHTVRVGRPQRGPWACERRSQEAQRCNVGREGFVFLCPLPKGHRVRSTVVPVRWMNLSCAVRQRCLAVLVCAFGATGGRRG